MNTDIFGAGVSTVCPEETICLKIENGVSHYNNFPATILCLLRNTRIEFFPLSFNWHWLR